MSIKIEFLDEQNGSIEIGVFDENSFFGHCYGMEVRYDNRKGCCSYVKMRDVSAVLDFLTKNSLDPFIVKNGGAYAVNFHERIMRELFKFVNKNRDVFLLRAKYEHKN